MKKVGARVMAAAMSADEVSGYNNDRVKALAEAMCDGRVDDFERLAARVAPEVVKAIRWSLRQEV